MLWNRHGPADGRRMSGGWTVDGRRMTVDDGEWAADVCRLMHEVSDTVKAKFGVELEPEVKILGTDF